MPVRPEYRLEDEHGRCQGRRMAAKLLAMPDPPTAIVADSDTQAFGALEAARAAGCRVPEDLSLIGYDDIDMAEVLGLTTIRQLLFESGRLGMELLLDLLQNPQAPADSAYPAHRARGEAHDLPPSRGDAAGLPLPRVSRVRTALFALLSLAPHAASGADAAAKVVPRFPLDKKNGVSLKRVKQRRCAALHLLSPAGPAGTHDQRKGRMAFSSSTVRKPPMPTIAAVTVQVLKVSRSVNPLMRPTTQKPLSFIQEMTSDPPPVARAA